MPAAEAAALQRAVAFAEPLLAGRLLDTGEDAMAHADGVAAIAQGFRRHYYQVVRRTLHEQRQVLPCYAGVAEFSVYVAREARGRGVGSALLAALVERAGDIADDRAEGVEVPIVVDPIRAGSEDLLETPAANN